MLRTVNNMMNIREQMEQAIDDYYMKSGSGKPWLNRDFRCLTVEEMEAHRVLTQPGTYCELYSTGTGNASWFFYHSLYQHACFLIWRKYSADKKEWTYGCRTDTHRLRYEERIWV